MTVPQLPFGLTAVRAEFGGVAMTPMSAYVKGGAYVPAQTLAPIPTTLPLTLSAFAGATYPAQLTFDHATVSNGFTISTAVVAPDLSTATIVLSRTKVVNGGSTWFEASSLRLLFNIAGAADPSIVLRLPPTQPRDGAGYWKQISASDFKRVCAPAQLTPIEDYSTYEHFWHGEDTGGAGGYIGEFRVNTLIPIGNAPTPPQVVSALLGSQAKIDCTIVWTMGIGSAAPPGSAMSWNTRNVTNTYVEFPIIVDVYDAGLLRASYTMTLHVEFNCLTTFNPS